MNLEYDNHVFLSILFFHLFLSPSPPSILGDHKVGTKVPRPENPVPISISALNTNKPRATNLTFPIKETASDVERKVGGEVLAKECATQGQSKASSSLKLLSSAYSDSSSESSEEGD